MIVLASTHSQIKAIILASSKAHKNNTSTALYLYSLLQPYNTAVVHSTQPSVSNFINLFPA